MKKCCTYCQVDLHTQRLFWSSTICFSCLLARPETLWKSLQRYCHARGRYMCLQCRRLVPLAQKTPGVMGCQTCVAEAAAHRVLTKRRIDRAGVVRDRIDGYLVREIADRHRCSREHVHYILREEGYTLSAIPEAAYAHWQRASHPSPASRGM